MGHFTSAASKTGTVRRQRQCYVLYVLISVSSLSPLAPELRPLPDYSRVHLKRLYLERTLALCESFFIIQHVLRGGDGGPTDYRELITRTLRRGSSRDAMVRLSEGTLARLHVCTEC